MRQPAREPKGAPPEAGFNGHRGEDMPTPITRKGYEALKAELDRLHKVERPRVIEAIAEARAHGDLSENAEYDAAKERQGFIEARLSELKGKLADCRIIDIAGRTSDTVVFGATVVLIEQEAQAKKQKASSVSKGSNDHNQTVMCCFFVSAKPISQKIAYCKFFSDRDELTH